METQHVNHIEAGGGEKVCCLTSKDLAVSGKVPEGVGKNERAQQ